jgi:cyclophilin family peptidyl-prolyl cis-trans isomerase
MAKHKAPTEVTVAPLFEKSTLEKTFDRFKYPVAALILVIVAWVVFNHVSQLRSRQERHQSWETLLAATTPDPLTRLPSASAETLAGVAEELKGEESGPWARLLEIEQRLEDRDFDGALQAIEALRRDRPDHALVSEPVQAGEERMTVLDRLERVARERKTWEAERPGLFANPSPPEGSPRVRLVTSAGTIEVALYAEKAPQHVENFLKLCRERFYDGTKFHRIVRGFMIQGGDPNSREGDPSEWGLGGPEYTLPPEPNDLYHFAGVLSAAKKGGETEENGSQFFLTTDSAHHLDGQHTIFGEVTSGMDVVRAIGEAPTEPGQPTDRPQSPVTIESTEILE